MRKEEEEEAVCKSLRPSESVTYNVTQSETHSTALFLQQEHTVEHVTPPNVVFRANIYDLKVVWSSVIEACKDKISAASRSFKMIFQL